MQPGRLGVPDCRALICADDSLGADRSNSASFEVVAVYLVYTDSHCELEDSLIMKYVFIHPSIHTSVHPSSIFHQIGTTSLHKYTNSNNNNNNNNNNKVTAVA